MQDRPRLNPDSPGLRNPPSPKAVPVGAEIKRSSWYAGMATDPTLPPPGSPAAWQGGGRQNSRSSINRPQRPSVHSPLPQFGGPLDGAVDTETFTDDNVSDIFMEKKRRQGSRSSFLAVPSALSAQKEAPSRSLSPIRSVSGSANGPEEEYNPFNFQSTYVTPTSRPPSGGRASQRRGHRYKHSSVSMNFFQEPEERAPLAIPVSLAVPTLREYWQSINRRQGVKLAWCFVRMLIAALVYSVGSPVVHSVSMLAHLLAYETVVSTTVALVEVLANFDVWKQSSLRLPFALKRVEVLVAFGLAAVLIFIGGDVFSHIIQEVATGGHHGHNHSEHASEGGSTKHTKHHIGIVALAMLSILPSVMTAGPSNPLAGSTLLIAGIVLIVPLIPQPLGRWIDALLTPIIGLTMVWLGWATAKLFGGMLVMSYGGTDRSQAIADLVASDPCVAEVSDISLWQVHHDLWLASMCIVMSGKLEDERRVREAAAKAVRTVMGSDIGVEVEWETTIDITRADVDM